ARHRGAAGHAARAASRAGAHRPRGVRGALAQTAVHDPGARRAARRRHLALVRAARGGPAAPRDAARLCEARGGERGRARGAALMLRLYYAPHTCALASHIVLEQARARYETRRVDFSRTEQRSAEYLAVNPKARVPALVTDRGVLTETPAILLYVCQLH